jgi:hypothetical protein
MLLCMLLHEILRILRYRPRRKLPRPLLRPRLLPLPLKGKHNLDGNEHDDNPLEVRTVLMAEGVPQHSRDLLRVIHLLVQRLDANAHVERLPDLVVVALEAEVVPAVPEEVREGVGQLGVVVQLRAEREELAGLLEDEAPGKGQGAPREDRGDVSG